MVSTRYAALISYRICPACASSLSELFDLWGPFYACEACGYEFDPVELEPNHTQSLGQPAFAGSSSLDWANSSDATQMVWQASGEAYALPLSR
jgi:rubredoxin